MIFEEFSLSDRHLCASWPAVRKDGNLPQGFAKIMRRYQGKGLQGFIGALGLAQIVLCDSEFLRRVDMGGNQFGKEPEHANDFCY